MRDFDYFEAFRTVASTEMNAPNAWLSAAPLAGVWRVEDAGTRQVPGTLRAADP